MRTFKLTLAYDGTEFSGWQAQPGRRTVQGVLRKAWQEITGETVRMTATSRTDAGVHALGQVIGIESQSRLAPERLLGGLNAKLPSDVVLLSVEQARDGFHATHDAVGKRYRYQLHNDRRRPLLDRHVVWHIRQPLDVAAMRSAGQMLVGKHDFASFQSTGSPRDCTVRTISAIEIWQGETNDDGAVNESPPQSSSASAAGIELRRSRTYRACTAVYEHSPRVTIEVSGNGFLYNMVRNIVGTLVEVGLGRRSEASVGEVLAACDRRAAGQTAPPHGLLLMEVAIQAEVC